jgi:hypothetical protein
MLGLLGVDLWLPGWQKNNLTVIFHKHILKPSA